VVERGTHDQLVAARGRYAALQALQLRQDVIDETAARGAAQ
jgi:hypothetical protein